MSNPHEVHEPDPSIPQFDRAEFEPGESGRPFCRVCRLPLEDEYYDVGGNVVCPACIVKSGRVGSRFVRVMKGFLFGSIAAGVGAAIYRMILFGTGWNIGLVAVVVGYMVGGAVRTGSGERGGRFYQFLAVFLTYSAIVGMFVPEVWKAIAAGPKARKEAAKAAGKEGHEPPKGEVGKKAGNPPADNGAQQAAGEKPPPPSVLYRLYLIGMLLLTLLLMIGLMYLIPLYVGFHNPISLLIFCFALWEAWKMNRASDATVTGPYRVRA